MRVAALGVLLWTGCGDPLLCKSDVFVAIETRTVTTDVDPAPGVQTDLALRTSLDAGTQIALQIQDGNGLTTGSASAVVDDNGDATVRVTLPTPRATVRATASSQCGQGEDQVTLDVTANATCMLALAPAPHPAPFYAPLGVLLAADDADSSTAGLQVKATIATSTDWEVDVWVGGAAGEHAAATNVPTTNGVAPTIFATLPEGQATLRAVCHDGMGSQQVATLATTLVVDSHPPTCDIASPADGTTITRAFDFDHVAANGIQLPIAVTGGGADDVEGETFTITATPGSGTPVTGTGTFDDRANGSAIVTVGTGTYAVVLVGRDHAGNPCSATRTYPVDNSPP